MIGTPDNAPNIAEIEKALEAPSRSIVINLLAIPLADRPLFFAALLPRLLELRTRHGHPHWIVIDEAHHLLPSSWDPAAAVLPQTLGGMVLITVHPNDVAHAALKAIDMLIAVGKDTAKTISDFAQTVGEQTPADLPSHDLEPGLAAAWLRRTQSEALVVKTATGTFDRRRHVRKYAEGELPEHRSFYFRGPEGKLNLRVQNLNMFIQIAEGVDDETWLYHLRRCEYSGWIRWAIKDDELVAEIEAVERDVHDPAESREQIKSAIERRYTAAA
jgi:hypothetical protein